MTAKSKLLPRLYGPIVRLVDAEHFIVFIRREKEVLAHKDFWEVHHE